MLDSYVSRTTRWLDLGCGHNLLPAWLPASQIEESIIIDKADLVVGIDADVASLRQHNSLTNKIAGDIESLPFKDESFSLVTANVVIEHVKSPDLLLAEVRRVLRPNGLFIFHTPNAISYATAIAKIIPEPLKIRLVALLQNREARDVYPTCYRMNTRRTIERLARQHGLKVLNLNMVESSAQTVALGPIVLLELLLIKGLRSRWLCNFRTNIIAVLQRAQ